MKIVVAPDSFKGVLSAAEAASAISAGLKDALPDVGCIEVPVADGGEATAAALARRPAVPSALSPIRFLLSECRWNRSFSPIRQTALRSSTLPPLPDFRLSRRKSGTLCIPPLSGQGF